MRTFIPGGDNIVSEASRRDKPGRAELALAGIPVVAFYVLVLLKSISTAMLVAATLLFIGVLLLIERRRSTPPSAFELFGVGMGSAFALLILWTVAGNASEWEWVAIALASLGAQSLYASYRIPKGPEGPAGSLADNAIHGLKWGLGLSVALTLAVVVFRGPLIAVVVATNNQSGEARGLIWVPVAYISAGIIAGLLIGVMRGAARWPAGRVFLGLVGGMVAYGIIGALMPLIDPAEEPMKVIEVLAMAFGLGAIGGPATAFYWADLIPSDSAVTEKTLRTSRRRSSH